MSQANAQSSSSSYGDVKHRIVDSQLISSSHYGSVPPNGQGNYQTGWSKTEQIPGGLRSTNFNESQQVTSTTYGTTVISNRQGGTRYSASGEQGQSGLYTQYQTGYRQSLGSLQGRNAAVTYDFTQQEGFRGSRLSTDGYSARLVDSKEGEPRLVDIQERETRVIEERTFEGESRIVNERMLKRERRSETREAKREDIQIQHVQQPRIIELIRENPVPYEVTHDVIYDVIIDVPIQRTIEREIITEITMEKPIEKIVEVAIEQIIEVPVECIVEVPTEVRRTVNRPFERIVHRPYDVIRENIVYTENVIDIDERDIGNYPQATVLPTEVSYEQRQKIVERPVYIENVIVKMREVHTQKIIEVPTERIVERKVIVEIDRPVPVDREVIQNVDVPMENIIYRNVDYVVERPVMRENIIERRVPIERLVEKEVIERVEHVVEVPVIFENTIEKPVEMLVEVAVPTERIVEVPVEELHETEVEVEHVTSVPREKIIRKLVPVIRQVEVPFEFVVERTINVPVEYILEKKINKFIEIPVEKIVERQVEVERIVEKPVVREVYKDVFVESVVENIITVEKVTYKEVVVDTVVEKEVEVIVEQVVEVPVERVVEVEVIVRCSRPVFVDHSTEEFYNVETEVVEYTEEYLHEEVVSADDDEMGKEIDVRKQEMQSQKNENFQLKNQFDSLRQELTACRESGAIVEENENIRLKARLADLTAVFKALSEQKSMLYKKSINRSVATETVLRRDPVMEHLKSQLRSLIEENHVLIKNVKETSEQVTSIVQRNSMMVSSSQFGPREYRPRSSYKPVSQTLASSSFSEASQMRRSLVESTSFQPSATRLTTLPASRANPAPVEQSTFSSFGQSRKA